MNYLAKIFDKEFKISLQEKGEELAVNVEDENIPVEIVRMGGTNTYSFLLNNKSFEVEICKNENSYIVHHQGKNYNCIVEDERLARLRSSIKITSKSTAANEIKSPMPGLVVTIEVEVGQQVKAGDGIIIIEAMKMENEIKAPVDATVKEIKVEPRQAVEMGQTLVVLV